MALDEETGPPPPGRTPFDTLFCALLPRLYRRAVMLSGARQSAEDAVHETYLKLVAGPERLLAHPEPYAYAFAALLSAVRDARRKEIRQVPTEDPGAAQAHGWDGGLARRQSEWEALRLLSRLSARQAGVVILVDLDGYTIDQAAKIMKVHRGTAARHRARALEKLRTLAAEGQDAREGRNIRDGERHEQA
ncbi:RNA polymerase sigma factor [Streptomyces sp. NPDC058220]|uniref:RNA polymerase sigma factor n=1 Tax=unclassified Streptomyces TaxID=2593676 RepID=UPI0036656C18